LTKKNEDFFGFFKRTSVPHEIKGGRGSKSSFKHHIVISVKYRNQKKYKFYNFMIKKIARKIMKGLTNPTSVPSLSPFGDRGRLFINLPHTELCSRIGHPRFFIIPKKLSAISLDIITAPVTP
jgi:hypothetical protein